MNLIVTNQCNRGCPYCFAKNKVTIAEGGPLLPELKFISLENVGTFLDFLSNSHLKEFKILGGEPTLHPELGEIIRMGMARGFNIMIFTNGLWPDSFMKSVSDDKNPRLEFLFNVNEPELQTDEENHRQALSLKIAGERARLGFNVYRLKFDLTFVVDLIESYSLRRDIRLGLASPVMRNRNQFIKDRDLPRTGKRLVAQLKKLEKKNIIGYFDCGFPLCMFKEKDLGSLVHCTVSGFTSSCGNVIDVDWDLKGWPCLPLSDLFDVHLKEFSCRDELLEFFREKTVPLKQLGSRKGCLTCKYLYRGQCTGGCMARTLQDCRGERIGLYFLSSVTMG
jgi:MoaA/NifB/PqqE/SkfB family radical SAM enzyme